MQSFKTFLTEAPAGGHNISFNLTGSIGRRTSQVMNAIRSGLEKKFGGRYIFSVQPAPSTSAKISITCYPNGHPIRWDDFQGAVEELLTTLNRKLTVYTTKASVLTGLHAPMDCSDVNTTVILSSSENNKAIEKYLTAENVIVTISANPAHLTSKGLLWLLNIKGLKRFVHGWLPLPPEIRMALNIMDGHVVDKDILACQEELIDAGLEKYAEL
jgi:hypothetical protein